MPLCGELDPLACSNGKPATYRLRSFPLSAQKAGPLSHPGTANSRGATCLRDVKPHEIMQHRLTG